MGKARTTEERSLKLAKEATSTASKFSCSEWAVGWALGCCPDLFGCTSSTAGAGDGDTVVTWESDISRYATPREENAAIKEVELARSLSFVDQVLYRIENEAMIGEAEDDDATGSSYTTSAYDSELSASGAASAYGSELSDRKDIMGGGREDSRPAEEPALDNRKDSMGGGQEDSRPAEESELGDDCKYHRGDSRPAERSRRERLLHAQRVRRKERLARSRSCPGDLGDVGNDSAGTADVRTWSSGTMRYMMV